ncbi:TetR/AcrR family transcriptional regulator [Gordonia sp. (in: high G+C Gram-positive bacteria)]|uniref:TetR/AcrR family transcriptional regulator n=1 Tax=Gordonia sp. (in: high G+C Gram-positive bacteria) TaxID=84139 RepID=UPI0016B6E1EF|nr:TetR/AcrR family transcriptional regulator [Gordonia sp. (in: high G+C Gram-positive bacteria)]NLG46949.1 TetR/AcrR family transcriptional regulator [Gordonia sp. (in: high G+C Gram-positive bacteria)]
MSATSPAAQSPGAEPPRARGAKSEATRARIIDAAAKVLAENGYQHTRLSTIAEAAGMQAGSLYYHFDSKEQLVEEALAGATHAVHAAVLESLASLSDDATAGQRLFAAMRAFMTTRMELGAVSPAHIRSYRELPAEMRERLRPEMEAVSNLWERLVADAVASGEIRNDIDAHTLHLFVFHTSEQIAKWPPGLKTSIPETIDKMFRLMVTGLTGS